MSAESGGGADPSGGVPGNTGGGIPGNTGGGGPGNTGGEGPGHTGGSWANIAGSKLRKSERLNKNALEIVIETEKDCEPFKIDMLQDLFAKLKYTFV